MANSIPGRKNVYSWAEFLRAITPDEHGAFMELALSTASTAVARAARRMVAIWQAEKVVDFNDPSTVEAVTWLVNNTPEWTGARALELAG